jgi:ElaB/YqjD/DUF883 family membrane-anchored ribosome-binding protein
MEMALFTRRREDLPGRLERKGSELSQMAAERGAETSRKVSDILRRASEDIRSVETGDYRERVKHAMSKARGRVDDTADMARDNIRTHPLASVAVAAGVGMLLGAALGAASYHAAREYRY